MEVYRTTAEGRIEINSYDIEIFSDKFLSSAYGQILIFFDDEEYITKNDVLYGFGLPIPDPQNDMKLETRKMFDYIIDHFDELVTYLLEQKLLIHIPRWSKQLHFRFSAKDRLTVKTLLLVHKVTNFTLKDILFTHIIPNVLGLLDIPEFYTTGLHSDITENDLEDALKGPLSTCSIFKQRYVKSYAYFTYLKYDDYYAFLRRKQRFSIDGNTFIAEHRIR